MNRFTKYFAVIAASALLAWTVGMIFFSLTVIYAQPERPEEKSDAIIVLTGGGNRIATGLRLLAEGRAGEVFVSGVNPGVSIEKIRSMHAGEPPLPACCIATGFAARNTRENAAETRDWLQEQNCGSIRLVTGDYHMARAMLEFRSVMPGMEIVRHPVKEHDIRSLKFWKTVITEYNKVIATWMRQMLISQTLFRAGAVQ